MNTKQVPLAAYLFSVYLAIGGINAYAQTPTVDEKQASTTRKDLGWPDHETQYKNYVYKGPPGVPTGWISITPKLACSHISVYVGHDKCYAGHLHLYPEFIDVLKGGTMQYEVAAGVYQIRANPDPDMNPGSEEYDVTVKPGQTIKLLLYTPYHGPVALYKNTEYLFSHPGTGKYPYRFKCIDGSQDLETTRREEGMTPCEDGMARHKRPASTKKAD
jgi:hypothetical protein